jgi:hypothetical protein
MRCLLCASEMVVMHVVADNTMPVAGFERHTFQCPSCGDVEQRLMFNRHGQDEAQPVQVSSPPVSPGPVSPGPLPPNPEAASSERNDDEVAAPPVSPTATPEGEPIAASTVWARALAKLRGR